MAQHSAAPLERLLRRESLIIGGGLVVLCALAWAYLLQGAGLGMDPWRAIRLSLFPHEAAGVSASGMAMGTMSAAPVWSPALWAITVAMWWVMMVAMMIPSAAPAILLYGRVRRHAAAGGQSAGLASVGWFAVGYLLVWLGFSIVAAGLYWALERAELVSAEFMGSQSAWLSAGLLAAAGLYQLSPLQNACLSHCRSPAQFLTLHWRPGLAGALRLGSMHGAYCLGCCWLLMSLLFVGGIMNLAWIAALTVLVLAQKVLPGGRWIAMGSGVILLVWAAATRLL